MTFGVAFRLSGRSIARASQVSANREISGEFSFFLDSAANGCLFFLLAIALLGLALTAPFTRNFWPSFAGRGAFGFVAFGLWKSLYSKNIRPFGLWTALAALTWFFAPFGLGAAWLALARRDDRQAFLIVATLYLGAAVVLFYQRMSVSFPVKALFLSLSGVIALILAWALSEMDSRSAGRPPKPKRNWKSLFCLRPVGRTAILAIALVFLGLINVSVFSNERLLSHGQVTLAELRPVDPLSLTQGYYQRINLDIEAKTRQALPQDARKPGDGLIVTTQVSGIAKLKRLYAGEPLAEGESLLAFRIGVKGDVSVCGGAYFFQEEAAKAYAKARYAELRVDPKGRALLSALLDSERRVIAPPIKEPENPAEKEPASNRMGLF
jgi:uncharacterized membrane-anchored protein